MTGALHNRRPHFVSPIEWAGVHWLIGIGFDDAGHAAEVWADLADAGVIVEPAVMTLVHEASITCSHLLQRGIAADVHAERLAPSREADAGLLHLMCRSAAALQRELGADLQSWLALRCGREPVMTGGGDASA